MNVLWHYLYTIMVSCPYQDNIDKDRAGDGWPVCLCDTNSDVMCLISVSDAAKFHHPLTVEWDVLSFLTFAPHVLYFMVFSILVGYLPVLKNNFL